jgi:hypothetical protein
MADSEEQAQRPSQRRSLRSIPKSAIDFDTVRKIGLELPGVEEVTAYGSPALRVHGKLLACIPIHRSAEPDSLMVRVDFDDRAQLLAEAPDVYYLTDHYLGYPSVLVRLSHVTSDVLRDLLGIAYKFVTSKTASRSRGRRRRKSCNWMKRASTGRVSEEMGQGWGSLRVPPPALISLERSADRTCLTLNASDTLKKA